VPFSWKSEKTSSRKFVDLIWRRSSKWAVWDPPIRSVRLGDYGTIDKETGGFDREGSIYDDPDLAKLVENCQPTTSKPQDDVLAVASAEKRKTTASASVSADAQVAQVVFEGKYDFGSRSGAVLAAYKPVQSSLPYDLNYEAVAKKLAGKHIVSSITMCPAYALYLGSKEDSGITLSLQAELPIPAAPGVSAGPGASIKWVKEYGGGLYREGNVHEPRFTVLFDLRQCKMRVKKTWLRDSPEPDFEGTEKLEPIIQPPWGILDDEGDEEPPYVHQPYKLPLDDDDEWD